MSDYSESLEGASDPELLRRARDARDELFKRHHDLVRRVAVQILRELGDRTEAMVNEAFLDANRSFFSCRENFGAWIKVIVQRKCFALIRSAKKEREKTRSGPVSDQIASSAPSPEDDAMLVELRWELVERRVRLVELLHDLSPQKRKLALSKISALQTTEIAHYFGKTSVAVDTMWSRIRAKLCAALGSEPKDIWHAE